MDKLITGAEKLGLQLSRKQVRQFEEYCREMLDWNQRINLTAITGYEQVQIRHFLDSLTIYSVLDNSRLYENLNILDVGAGAGLPGIPLKIALPEMKLALIEATAKKTEFLNYVVSTLGLENVEVVTGRAEDLAHKTEYRARFNVVISRAVASLAALAELTLPFCPTGGTVITPKKGDVRKEVEESLKAIDILGGSLREVRLVELDDLIDDRYLVIIDKVSPTPDKYPRRPGIPEKRPIK
ncbi:MAG: 16S rRNA (guanine(527)-N(7))-methyltransferase RsmG [Dehalococcoidales bacterium]|nr:MAG: 16S rRNA (guanine(527)-N(7))-methyltransferase RsmG [Dehalococcoidales bacterium]